MSFVLSALLQKSKFSWNKEYEFAIQKFKKYLIEPPLLSTPDKGALLYVYLAISEHAASSVLLIEVDREQCPIYFVRKKVYGLPNKVPTTEKAHSGSSLNLVETHA